MLDEAVLYDDVAAAIADCSFVLATTARAHDQAKPVLSPEAAAREIADHMAGHADGAGGRGKVAILFGRERYGLENAEVALADRIVTFPVNPAFASLNLAQAVALIAYEWFKLAAARRAAVRDAAQIGARRQGAAVRLLRRPRARIGQGRVLSPAREARHHDDQSAQYLRPHAAHAQDIQTLHGVILAIAEGRKGPARGGVLSGEEAEMLRALLAEHGEGIVPDAHGPVRGLARLLRRNPTEAERALWSALTNDRRFAGRGFKRQVPIGPHINDFVSFALRIVIEMVPDDESAPAAAARAQRTAWLEERGYRIIVLEVSLIERDLSAALDGLAAAVDAAGLPSKA